MKDSSCQCSGGENGTISSAFFFAFSLDQGPGLVVVVVELGVLDSDVGLPPAVCTLNPDGFDADAGPEEAELAPVP
jgi:hypothetical protein